MAVSSGGRKSTWKAACFAAALYLLLTILMTWPLGRQLADAVIGFPGDNFYYVWLVGWAQKALFELHCSPLRVAFLNYPEGWNLAYSETTPAMVLTALPFSLLGGPALGYNVSLLLSYVLSGLGVYLWVRKATGVTAAALVAGTIFAFSPYRMAHAYGHFPLMGTQWLPFFFMALSDLLECRDRIARRAFLAALFYSLSALSSQYYLYMTLILAAAYVAIWTALAGWRRALASAYWRRLGALAAMALPGALLAAAPPLLLALRHGAPTRALEDVGVWSASPTDFLLPSARHFLWGGWIEAHFDTRLWFESSLYLGAVALSLSLAAFSGRGEEAEPGRRRNLLALASIAAVVLSMGTELHWLGRPVMTSGGTTIPMPGRALFQILPYYSEMRVWMRYGVYASLFTSVLAGIGAARLLSGVNGRRRALLGAALVAFVLFDFNQGAQPMSPLIRRPADDWLAAQPGQGAVAQFPFWQEPHPVMTYVTLAHGKPYIGGLFTAFPPPQYERIRPILDKSSSQPMFDKAVVGLLQELGVQWVLVDLNADPQAGARFPQLRSEAESLGLRPVGAFGSQFIFELPPQPGATAARAPRAGTAEETH